MNPLSVFSSIFGAGTIAGGAVGGYFLHLSGQVKDETTTTSSTTSNPPPLVIPEDKKYTTFNYIPQEEQKYFPFSNRGQPDKYDDYLLINRKKSDGQASGTVNWGALASKIDDNNNGNFTCYIQTSVASDQTDNKDKENGGACQLFEIINKKDNDDPMKCPDKMDDLKPISFKGFKDGGGQNAFPDIFLFAVKYKDQKNVSASVLFAEIYIGNDIPAARQLMRINKLTDSNVYKQCSNIQ